MQGVESQSLRKSGRFNPGEQINKLAEDGRRNPFVSQVDSIGNYGGCFGKRTHRVAIPS